VFDDPEREPVQNRRDTELTLGSGTLLAIFFGLVLLCGLCFGLGYSVGRHGSHEPSAASPQAADNAQLSVQAEGSRAKPSATNEAEAAAAPQRAVADLPASNDSDEHPAAATQSSAPAVPASQPVAKPALQPQSSPGEPAQPLTALNPEPAGTPLSPLMVQIAAVSHQEDADVLVNALRKRGYAVTARRDATDGLIHVRIGPFANRNDAYAMRQHLLNDGYNAILQP